MATSFVDKARISIHAGRGGDGAVSFHREKYIAAGARLDAADTLGGLWPAAKLLLSSAALAPVGGYGFALLVKGAQKIRLQEAKPANGKKVFLGAFAFILICWLPLFLAYYPGMFNFDSTGEITQINSGNYSANFPLIHTLLLGAFYRLGGLMGSYNTGIALYTIAQCAAVAAEVLSGCFPPVRDQMCHAAADMVQTVDLQPRQPNRAASAP